MVMKALRDGAAGGIMKFVLFGILIMAVGGIVLMDVGGFFRGGVASNDAAKIGMETIPVTRFDATLRRTLSRIGMGPKEAYRQGYVDQLLNSEVRARIIDQTANKYGIIISQENVAHHIRDLVTPLMQPGQTPRDVLEQILASQGMSESEFSESIAREMSNKIIYDAIEGGFADVSPAIVKDVVRYRTETRDISYISFKASEIKNIKPPSEEKLREFYDMQKSSFVIPETRDIKVLSIDDSALKETLEISKEKIETYYKDNIDLYSKPERLTLEQAIFSDQTKANKVASAIGKDKSLETAVKKVTGKTSAYLGEKVYAKNELLEELKAPIDENKKQNAVIGPIKTPLGWSVVLIKKITPEKVSPLSAVQNSIKEELKETELIDQLYALANTLDDMLAGGNDLETISEQIDLKTVTFKGINRFGQKGKKAENAFVDHGNMREAALETGFELSEGETSPVMEMADGKLAAIHVSAIHPLSYKPFEEVKDKLLKSWMDKQKDLSARQEAQKILADNLEEPKPLKKLAQKSGKRLTEVKTLNREGKNKKDLSAEAVSLLFKVNIQEPIIVKISGGYAVAQVEKSHLQKSIDENSEDFKNVKNELLTSSRNAGTSLFVQKHSKRTGAMINEALLVRVYGGTQQDEGY